MYRSTQPVSQITYRELFFLKRWPCQQICELCAVNHEEAHGGWFLQDNCSQQKAINLTEIY